MKNLDRCVGAYIGAAIGDSMGGPVESLHFEKIRGFFPNGVDTLLEYKPPYAMMTLKPGYALRSDAGSITDDTYIRKDITKYLLECPQPYEANELGRWLADNATIEQWWPPVVEVFKKIKAGEVDGNTSGMTHMQGGGIGWWSPIGILCSGQPEKAAKLARSLCCIWKASLEQDFCAAFAASVAVATMDGSTWEDVVDAMLKYGGELSRKLLQRAIDIAKKADGLWDLARKLYDEVLIGEEPTRLSDGPMPEKIVGLDYTDEYYTCFYWAEQLPLAIAALVYGKGSIESIGYCVSIGRDCDTTATTVGAWVGALNGLKNIPQEWVDAVCKVNINELDLMDLATKITEKEVL